MDNNKPTPYQPEPVVYEIRRLPDLPPDYNIPLPPKRPVSPYAKFDRMRKKRKK